MLREEFLLAAKKCICGQREEDYGSPENNFALIAALWDNYLYARDLRAIKEGNTKRRLLPEDVAVMMALLKTARIATGAVKDDNYVDAIGYFACAGELATIDLPENSNKETEWGADTPEKFYELNKENFSEIG